MLANRISGKASTFQFSTLNDAGDIIAATSATWQLKDARGAPLTNGVITDYNSAIGSFVVPAADLTTLVTQGREIVATLTTANGPVSVSQYFLLVAEKPITLLANSFLTYPEAMAVRTTIAAPLISWDTGDEISRTSGLIDAHEKISRIAFSLPTTVDLQSLPSEFAAHGTGSDEVPYSRQRVSLRGMPVATFDALPEGFKTAVRRAQLYEANASLGGDISSDARDNGILSETIGESSTTFSSKPFLKLPLTAKAHNELRRYIKLQVGLARSG